MTKQTLPIAIGLLLAASPLASQGSDAAAVVAPMMHLAGNGFFVLGSDYPVRIRPDAATAPWLHVEPVDAARSEPRVVAVRTSPGLPAGTHRAAFRIEVVTERGREEIGLGVETCVGEACPGGDRDRSAASARLEDARADVRVGYTPAGNLLIEIVDKEREGRDVAEARARVNELRTSQWRADAGFALVLPWMCLEYPCGSSTALDVADAQKGLDAINAVSYERYTIREGVFSQHPVGNPGPWARGAGLAAWPMVTGGNEPSPTAVLGMWENRDRIADRLLSEARDGGYAGYCLDVEGHADAATRATFLAFVSYLADRLHVEGLRLMVATATWSTIAPFDGLAQTSADFIASMDPYTSLWRGYVPANYAAVEPARLLWGFTWDRMPREAQLAMWEWMQASGYNSGVAGAAAWRTPLAPPHPGNDLDYYEALRAYYPARRP